MSTKTSITQELVLENTLELISLHIHWSILDCHYYVNIYRWIACVLITIQVSHIFICILWFVPRKSTISTRAKSSSDRTAEGVLRNFSKNYTKQIIVINWIFPFIVPPHYTVFDGSWHGRVWCNWRQWSLLRCNGNDDNSINFHIVIWWFCLSNMYPINAYCPWNYCLWNT